MSKYSSEEITLKGSAEHVFDVVSNPEALKKMLDNIPADKIPEDKRAMFDNLKLEGDCLEIPGGPVGSIKLKINRNQRPSLVELSGIDTPVAMSLKFHLTPQTADSCKGKVELDIDIPMMLKPMIGGTLQKVVDQFAMVLKAIPFDKL